MLAIATAGDVTATSSNRNRADKRNDYQEATHGFLAFPKRHWEGRIQ
jgi:hypothetical protein